jgi:hypothetical protein
LKELEYIFGFRNKNISSVPTCVKMETTVSPKNRDNSPTPGGDIREDVVDDSIYISADYAIIRRYN